MTANKRQPKEMKMEASVIIPLKALPAFTPLFQTELADWIQAQMSVPVDEADEADPSQMDESEEPADLSVAQAKKFLDRVSDKVRTTVRVMAEADQSGFDMNAVIKALEVADAGGLRGVWGGITKRVRTVLGDDEAYLIWWNEQDHDWVGRMSLMTHRSFRKVLGI